MKTLLLDKNTIINLMDIKESIKAVEYSFKQLGKGKVEMPPKLYLSLDRFNGDFRAMPAYMDGLDTCCMKWVNVHPGNKKIGLPTVMAVIILNDPKTGFPLCIMDGTYITRFRTGAGGTVAARYLAKSDSNCIGLVGCGIQARSQLICLNELFRIKEVKVWGPDGSLAEKFIRNMKDFPCKLAKDIQSCIQDTDIVVTTTPSRKPLVKLDWISKGTHINAIGADAKGKEELDPNILKNARVVVDNWEQASHSGEINVPLSKGIIKKGDIYADIGEIANGKKRGRINNNEITVFDSTGLAIQDLAVADLIYRKALKKKKGKWIDLIF